MAEIVKGLFGIDPQGYQEDRLAQQRAEAIQYSKLDPFQKATTAIYQGTQQGVGAGLNMMGVQDPELQAQQVAAQLAGQFDMTTADGLAAYSQALGQKAQETGLPALNTFANMAGQKAMSMKETTADIGYKNAQTASTQNKLDLDRQYRDEMQAAIERGASEEEKLNIALKYGGPDVQAQVLGRLEMQRERNAEANSGLGSLSPGQKARDTSFAKEYATFSDLGGKSVIDKNLLALDEAIALLEADPNLTGTTSQVLDATGTLSAVKPNAQKVKDLAGGVIQGNLRQVLGGQFASKEGEQLLARAFNIAQPGDDNLKRLKSLKTQIEDAARIKTAAGEYFEEYGTLKGFKPPKTPSQPTGGKAMPDAAKLQEYAAKHFGGDVAKATAYLSTQGYK
jgi:hypothetical protein